jgi:hypothetical protein
MPSVPVVNKAFKNQGDLKFSDAGLNWGFTTPSFSNGAAYGDLDNDGDLDLVVNNVNMPSFVYKNNSREISKNNYIGIQLKETGSNVFAIGSEIKIYSGNEIITRELIPSRGFQSSCDYKIIIGLGGKQPDSMIITWPDRTFSKINKPEINKIHTIQKPSGPATTINSITNKTETLFQLTGTTFEKHTEEDFVDFYIERNIPVMLSREGPKATVGDINKDGLDDILIGGAKGNPASCICKQKMDL